MGIGLSFLLPTRLVPDSPNVEDIENGMRNMHYGYAGIGLVTLILIIVCKVLVLKPSPKGYQDECASHLHPFFSVQVATGTTSERGADAHQIDREQKTYSPLRQRTAEETSFSRLRPVAERNCGDWMQRARHLTESHDSRQLSSSVF